MSSAVNVARDYYDSHDADHFYSIVWGGEDIHVGLYRDGDSVATASRRTVEHMITKLTGMGPNSRVLDLGSGYGGALRTIARSTGCRAVGLNLSEVENERARALNADQGLSDQVSVQCGNFEQVPFEDATYDVVWSQDAFLHSGSRDRVIAEAARVLRPGGKLIFTDPMQADNCPEGVLDPILARIHLRDLGSPDLYRETARQVGLQEIEFEDLTDQLIAHYTAVLRKTESDEVQLTQHIAQDYLQRMKQGLQHWIDGGEKGYLVWGIFLFEKQ